MKNLTKKLAVLTAVMGLAIIMGGCSSDSSDKSKNVEYVQTHQDDDVTSVNAKMYQKAGSKDKMGDIKFSETKSGLEMSIDLKDIRPNTEYKMAVYEMKGCDMKEATREMKDHSMEHKCKKADMNLELPSIMGDAKGKAKSTFMVTGLTAAELNNKKIVLMRENDNGEMVHVGWGILKQGMWF